MEETAGGQANRCYDEETISALAVFFGSESYSKEELIAKMTTAMLCGIAGIEPRIFELSRMSLLRSDSRLLVSAASQAKKAADFIQCQPQYELAEASVTQGLNEGLVG